MSDVFGPAARPSREALEATYSASCPAAAALLAEAEVLRAAKDHVAAGILEKDAAALIRMAHTRRALAWDAAERAATK